MVFISFWLVDHQVLMRNRFPMDPSIDFEAKIPMDPNLGYPWINLCHALDLRERDIV